MSDSNEITSDETSNVSCETKISNEISKENDVKTSEQRPSRRPTMPQDVRYSTEPDEHEKLIEKYENYLVSETDTCNIRFLLDHRQKQILLGHQEGSEQENLQAFAKSFDLTIFPGYQQSTKHSLKIFGSEINVRRCLIEMISRVSKRSNRTSGELSPNEKETKNVGPSSPEPTSVFITTINPDSSITEEAKALAPKSEQKDSEYKPTERKTEFKFTLLISSQGQEVLKKNWSFFGGSLQQRLNLAVSNPIRLTKFGDKQILYELIITGVSIENIIDGALQIISFINDVLGIPNQIYKPNEERNENQENQRRKSNNFNPRVTSSSNTNHSDRTFFNRNRNEIFEERILLRNDCVARIVGKRGSNIKLIKNKCHLRDLTISRDINENGYNECFLSAHQSRNLQFAIDTIRSFLHNEDASAVLVIEGDHHRVSNNDSRENIGSTPSQPSLTFSNQKETGFSAKSFDIHTSKAYPQPSYNFQNPPSFDFTHQATFASRKTDKRPGDLVENSPYLQTPSELDDHRPVHSSSSGSSSISPRHRSKRTCPETKEIHCTTEDGFWIQKQYYHALDDSSKELFDSLMEKLERIRIVNEENAAKKQQRIAGRTRTTKSRAHPSAMSSLTEDQNRAENNLPLKTVDKDNEPIKNESTSDASEEKENHQDIPTVLVEQN